MHQMQTDDTLILLDGEQVAEILGVSPSTLEKWRWKKSGPAYVQSEGKGGKVRYRLSDIKAYIEGRLVIPSGK